MFASSSLRASPTRRNPSISQENAEPAAPLSVRPGVARLVGRWTPATGGATLAWIWRLETP